MFLIFISKKLKYTRLTYTNKSIWALPEVFSVDAAIVDKDCSVYQGDAKCQIVDLGTEGSEDVVVPSEPSVEADDWGRLLTEHRVDPLLVTAN